MSDPDILDQIDDVIAWHGRSPDAMVWTAEPPKPILPTLPVVDSEAAQQLVVTMRAQVQAIAEAFRPIAEAVMSMARAFAAIVNTPPMQELVQEQRRARSAMKTEYGRRRRARGRRK